MRIKTDYPATSKDAVNLEYIQRIYPVGSLYLSTISTNPSDLLGFGTWEAWGKGKAIVGLDPDDADFDTAEETRGAKTHTLTSAELPDTDIKVYDGSNWFPLFGTGSSDQSGYFGRPATEFPNAANTGSLTGKAKMDGGSGAHNNIQPSIVAYLWKRTA